MARVLTTVQAGAQLARTPATRARVMHVLAGILDTATEMNRLSAGAMDPDELMRLELDGFEVSYSLDVERGCATVVTVRSPGLP